MINSKKKGFTIVELVIVIAVIAVLSAVLIPTFSNLVKKANVSSDTALVKNLNTALAADTNEHNTMTDALAAAKEFGYDIAKINAKANGNEILWDSKNDCFVYYDRENNDYVYIPDSKVEEPNEYDLWVIYDQVHDIYSTYLYECKETEVTAKYGLDVGECAIEVVNADNIVGEVVIRTTQGVLNINSSEATINHYGNAQEVYVNDVAAATYNLFGNVGYIEVKEGEHVVLKQGSSVSAVYAPSANIEVENGQNDAIHTTGEKNAIKDSATKFAGGLGTENNPYLIANATHMQNIDSIYNEEYKYFKVIDGIKTLDLTNYTSVRLNGSFDGNNVKLTNLTCALFLCVGYQNNTTQMKISNFDATLNNTVGNALVKNIFNAGTTTFENIKLHGYISGNYNMGSFYNYGTANYNDVGADYTVEFKNCQSDITLVCTTSNSIGGLLGHSYQGNGNTFTINIDLNTKYTGKMYTTGTAKCYEVMATGTTSTYILNGVETSRYINEYSSTKISTGDVNKTDNGYSVVVAEGASKLIIDLNSQLTAYDNDGNKIPNLSGITGVLKSTEKEVTNGETVNVFGSFNNTNIINGTNYERGANIDNDILNIYTGSSSNYASGTIKLFVKHIDSNGNIIHIDSITITTIE